MSYIINNNALEINPSPRNKRKRSLQCSNVYMNPALDLLSTEDAICNTAMEIKPAKRTRRSRSCDDAGSFENSALDIGIKRRDVYGLLRKELSNVNEKLPPILEVNSPMLQNSYQNLNIFNDASMEEKSILKRAVTHIPSHVNSTPVNQSRISIKQNTSFDLSFIEKLGIDDDINGEALYLDDDLNESNIMEIKTITVVSKKPKVNAAPPVSTNPFLNCVIDYDVIDVAPNEITGNIESSSGKLCNNFPFDFPIESLQPEQPVNESTVTGSSFEANSIDPETESVTSLDEAALPRRLFNETLNTTCNDPKIDINRVEHRISERQIDCNFSSNSEKSKDVFVFGNEKLNKQSKILGCDVSQISKNDIFNGAIPKKSEAFVFKSNQNASYPENNNYSKNKAKSGTKISTKFFGKIKDVFKHDKKDHKMECVNGNPYEVIRKPVIQEKAKIVEPVCFENPALNYKSIADEEFDEENNENESSSFQKRNPFEITPMKPNRNRIADKENYSQIGSINDCIDLSDICYQSNALCKKQVRFDSTLNHEKIVTGNSFDSNNSSTCSRTYTNHVATIESLTEIDSEIDNYHNELENCYNEKKFIRQNI